MKTAEAGRRFMTERKLRGLSPRTLENYQATMTRLERAYPKLPFNPDDIQAFIVERGGTPETQHQEWRNLRAFYNFLHKRYGYKNPMNLVSPPKVLPKVMPTLEALEISLLPLFIDNPRDRALVVLFLDTGIRATEAVDLQRKDIKQDYILVKGKVGQRAVPISEITGRLLLNLSVYDDGYVFHGNKGKLTRSGARSIVKKYLLKIGVTGPKLGPHRLRHTFGRHYLVNGGDIRSLQLILGHSNIKTTEKYASLAINDVITKHHKFTPARCFETQTV